MMSVSKVPSFTMLKKQAQRPPSSNNFDPCVNDSSSDISIDALRFLLRPVAVSVCCVMVVVDGQKLLWHS